MKVKVSPAKFELIRLGQCTTVMGFSKTSKYELKAGTRFTFVQNNNTSKEVDVVVLRVAHYKSGEDMFKVEDCKKIINADSYESACNIYRRLRTIEQDAKYGIDAAEIAVIPTPAIILKYCPSSEKTQI